MREASTQLQGVIRYATSLPERTLRSASAIAGGLRESSTWLVPSAFRNSKSYSIFVQQMLDFVASDLGGLRRVLSTEKQQSKEQVDIARKTVGNLLDMTALATFHISPVAVLAIFSDLAYGSKTYLDELANRLREQGIIDEQTVIKNATDLIEALEKATGTAADVFEQPPLSIESLKRTIQHTSVAIGEAEPQSLLPLGEIDQLWRQMKLAAKHQDASLWDISATITVAALNHVETVRDGTTVGLDVAGNLFHEQIVQHYWEGLRTIERDGLVAVLSNTSQPYLDAIWTNFSMDQKTWSEKLFDAELIKWGWSQFSWPKLPLIDKKATSRPD